MPLIRMDVLAEIYALYKFAAHEVDKEHIVEDGIRNILLRLKRYTEDTSKIDQKSRQAMTELETILERFYHQDKKFSKLIHSKAKAHVEEIMKLYLIH